jgi:hypothetical protein
LGLVFERVVVARRGAPALALHFCFACGYVGFLNLGLVFERVVVASRGAARRPCPCLATCACNRDQGPRGLAVGQPLTNHSTTHTHTHTHIWYAQKLNSRTHLQAHMLELAGSGRARRRNPEGAAKGLEPGRHGGARCVCTQRQRRYER